MQRKKNLRLQNDGEDFTVSSMLDKFPITSIQQASDCFRIGRFINQFRGICGPETRSNASVNTSNFEYSSINSLSPCKQDTVDSTSPRDDSNQVSRESEDDNLLFKLTKPESVKPNKLMNLVVGNTDASLVKKFLTTSDAPDIDTKALIQKLDEVPKTVDLDVSTILAERMKDPVLGTLRSWIRKNTPPDSTSPEIQQSKGLL